MFKKSLTALTTALVVATTLVSMANAQTRDGVQPYTAFEKLWFQLPEAPERMN